ncbi:M24 family metallopeptidase [Nocardioides humi]|nr:Xaa-Pro peptidase family protein [Nocardioides humi]
MWPQTYLSVDRRPSPMTEERAMEPPFDHRRLDELMDTAGLDAVLVTSKHNAQYLLGGHRFFFFDYMDAIGVSRYLPVVIYVRGRLDLTRYIANSNEAWQLDNDPVWVPEVSLTSWGSVDPIEEALGHLERVLPTGAAIGIESSFMPADAFTRLALAGRYRIEDCLYVLERLRARKSETELRLVEQASAKVVDAMRAVFSKHGEGTTKRELVEALRREQTDRGLTFEYCLVNMGKSLNRGASEDRWTIGDPVCLDSGGNFGGYIGDVARMAVLGEPDAELEDLLAEIDRIQLAARVPIRAGALGQEIYVAADEALTSSPLRAETTFLAHGMGLISHEAPRLTDTGPVPYPNADGGRPLEEGMVLSIETTLCHSRRGFIKLEDTVAVTDGGYRAFGDNARGWNVAG